MRRLRLGVAASVVAMAALVAFAPFSTADEASSLQLVNQQGRDLTFVVYLDPGIEATASTPVTSKVVVSSTEVPSEAKVIVEKSQAAEAIIVFDASGSMRGERIAAAREAAKNYVNALPPDVRIGLVVFNDNVETGINPTANHASVLDAIDKIKAGQKTALYDGFIAGSDMANADQNPRIVLLSDGGDTASAATLEDVQARIASQNIPVDVVALTPNVQHGDILKGIATSSGGQYLLSTDAGGLDQAFSEAAGSFGGKVAVTASVPENVNGSGKFAVVTVALSGTDYVATTKLPNTNELVNTLPETTSSAAAVVPPPLTPTTERGVSSAMPWLYALLAALIVVVLALSLAYYQRQRRALLRTEQVLWYSSAGLVDGDRVPRPGVSQFTIMKELDGWLSTRKSYPAVDAKLDNAGLNISPAVWLVTRIGIGAGLVLLFWILLGNFFLGLIAGVLLAWLGTRLFVNNREAKARKAFETELPDFLLLIASSLRSGLSFSQGLDSTAAEGVGQVSRQMRRALRESQMGAPIEQALLRVSERMKSEDLKWTVVALSIQREVGGNLSNILETAAATVQSRAELRREIRTLSAEGKLSGWILAAMPVGLFLYMLIANRTYVSFFWTNVIGYVCLAFIFVIFIIGFFWMRKLVKIEV